MSLVTEQQGTILTRLFATRTDIQWDPATNDGKILFSIDKFTYVDGELVSRQPQNGIMSDLGPLLGKVFDVEVSPGNIVQVPGALIMAAMKKAFEELYEEKTAPAPPIVPFEPPAEEPVPGE